MRPSALAVFMLITNSNLVGCSTGRSDRLGAFEYLVHVTACTAEQVGDLGAVDDQCAIGQYTEEMDRQRHAHHVTATGSGKRRHRQRTASSRAR